MNSTAAIEVAQQSIMTGAIMLAPLLVAALLAGTLMSILQTITQVQDQAISFVPKLIAVGVVLLLLLPWMSEYFIQYTYDLISTIPQRAAGG